MYLGRQAKPIEIPEKKSFANVQFSNFTNFEGNNC